MDEIIFVCKPDENGVYNIGSRYFNVEVYKSPFAAYIANKFADIFSELKRIIDEE
ncbi:MAG: hypothetical protein U0M42_02970 [Acutalibacteraceae bacterium]|nr:hypothetical protein [Acutalibacteraceae bacterium]